MQTEGKRIMPETRFRHYPFTLCLGILGLHRRPMNDYFSYLLLEKSKLALKIIFTITLYDGRLRKVIRRLSLRRVKNVCKQLTSHLVSRVRLSQPMGKSRKENPQKLTQLNSRSHPRHLVGKKTAQKDTIIDITSDSQVNSNFPYRWSPASLTFNNYFYLFL